MGTGARRTDEDARDLPRLAPTLIFSVRFWIHPIESVVGRDLRVDAVESDTPRVLAAIRTTGFDSAQ